MYGERVSRASEHTVVPLLILMHGYTCIYSVSKKIHIPYLLDQKPRLLIFSSRSRGRPLFESGYNSRAATILFINTKLSTCTSICILLCIFHYLQFKRSIKPSFLLGGSHTYQNGIRRMCYNNNKSFMQLLFESGHYFVKLRY